MKKCLHCLEKFENLNSDFCCIGCEGAYKIVNENGLGTYYKIRQDDQILERNKPENFNCDDDLSKLVFVDKNNSFSIKVLIQGIHCSACIWLIETILKKQKNIINARVNLTTKVLDIKWIGNTLDVNLFSEILHKIGYKIFPLEIELLEESEKKYDNSILKSLVVAAFGVGNIMLFSISLWFSNVIDMEIQTRNLFHFLSSFIALPVIIYSARPFVYSAFKSLKSGYPNMDFAISIAIFLASVVSVIESFRFGRYVYFDSVVMLLFFLLIGRYLDMKARKKAFNINAEFMMFLSTFAKVEEGESVKIVSVKNLKEGMIVVVPAGEKIPADGVVIEGESEVDSSIINGESIPSKILKGSEVFGGMINLENSIKLKVTKSYEECLLSKIIQLTNDIELKKNIYVRIADCLAKFYIPIVHILALFTFSLWYFYFGFDWEKSLMNATAVLIITCPCALALAVPIAQTIAISKFIKNGILVKSGESLEKINQVDLVVFDKTGSITNGSPQLLDMFFIDDNNLKEVDEISKIKFLKIASSMAIKSSHPISKAITKSYNGNLENFYVLEKQGFGLQTKFLDDEIKMGRKEFCDIEFDLEKINQKYLIENILSCFLKIGETKILMTFQDLIKNDAKQVISILKKMKKEVILLSGDVENVVRNVANQLEIEKFYSMQTPLSKAMILEKIKNEGKKFIMIGDGINDAPSLKISDISISFSKASSLAQNVADVVFCNDKLSLLIEFITSSKKLIKITKENIAIALVYNLIAIPFAILGFITPLIAALAMSSSSILVLLNSFRVSKNVNYNSSKI